MKLSQKIIFPDNLKPIYDFLQEQLNFCLSNPEIRNKILSVDPTLPKGTYWNTLRQEIKNETQHNWKKLNWFPTPSWYFNMFAECIRQIVKSQKDQIKLYTIIHQQFNNKISDELVQFLQDNNISYTYSQIKNISQMKECPSLPTEAILKLDFSASNWQISSLDEQTNLFGFEHRKLFKNEIKGVDNWTYIPLLVHPSTRYKSGNKVSKPTFSKDKNGNYYGVITYEYNEAEESLSEDVLGVDLGKIKLYSATVVRTDGSYGIEHIESKELQRLKDKVETLYEERRLLLDKQENVKQLIANSNYRTINSYQKLINRELEFEAINSKISNIKNNIAELIACELVELAIENNCGIIKFEELSWLGSKGGKWNHKDIQSKTELQAKLYGIKVFKVNCKGSSKEHSVTKELGKVSGRDIYYKDGTRINRDTLASINIGLRSGKRRVSKNTVYGTSCRIENVEKIKIKKLRDKHSATPKRVKRNKSRRKETFDFIDSIKSKNKLGDNVIVLFSNGTSLVDSSELSLTAIAPINYNSLNWITVDYRVVKNFLLEKI